MTAVAQLQSFPMPDVGEGLTEAEVLAWHVAPGDAVEVNQMIVEIETAKAAVELPCPFAGRVAELLVGEGETVDVGRPIIVIDTGGGSAPQPAESAESAESSGKIGEEAADGRVPTLVGYGPRQGTTARRRPRRAGGTVPPVPAPFPPDPPLPPPVPQPPEPQPPEPAPVPAPFPPEPPLPPPVPQPPEPPAPPLLGGPVPLAKPLVRKLARELGVNLRALAGSGPGGVITRDDVQGAVAVPLVAVGERRVPVRGVRRATAQAMVDSAFSAPHVTEFLTVDVTATMELRARLRGRPEFSGVTLTPLAFVARALCLAATRTPDVNARWDAAAGEIVYFEHVHLGIAAATPRGLIVPKIRGAQAMPLAGLAAALETLAATAREGRTAPEDLTGGTITITNVGVFGVDTGTPIINPGESAILAVGAIAPRPWVVDGAVVARTLCQLALSFDHRVVDGAQGSRFLADVGALLTDPALALAW